MKVYADISIVPYGFYPESVFPDVPTFAEPTEEEPEPVASFVRNPSIPEGAIEVSEEEYELFFSDEGHKYEWIDGRLRGKEPVEVRLNPVDLSLKQFALVLAQDDVLSFDEAIAWAATRVLPQVLVDLVEQIRVHDDTLANQVEMDLRASTLLQRYHGNTLMIASLLSTPERIFDATYLDSVWDRGQKL